MRSSMFYVSDTHAAAETAAFALEEHGLTPEQVEALSERIHDTITGYFAALDDAGERREQS